MGHLVYQRKMLMSPFFGGYFCNHSFPSALILKEAACPFLFTGPFVSLSISPTGASSAPVWLLCTAKPPRTVRLRSDVPQPSSAPFIGFLPWR